MSLVKQLYEQGFNLIPFSKDKKPLVSNYKEYLDGRLCDLNTLLNNDYIALKLGRQSNNNIVIAFDLENQIVKYNQGFNIEAIEKVLHEVLDAYNITTTTWINTSINKGLHYLYLADTNSIDNKAAFSFNSIGIELFLDNRSIIILGNNLENYNIGNIANISNDSLTKIITFLELLNKVINAIKEYYKQGNRDKIHLALSGYMFKAYYSIDNAKLLARCIMYLFNDREDRVKQCVEQTYKQERSKVASYELAKEVSKELADNLNKIFHKNNSNIVEFIISLIDKGYHSVEILARLLAKEYKEGNEDAKFIDNYRYVITKDNNYWIEWNGSYWEEANMTRFNKELIEYFEKKRSIIDIALINAIRELNNEELENMQRLRDTILDYFSSFISSKNFRDEFISLLSIANFFNITIDDYELDNINTYYINTLSHLLIWDNNLKLFNAIKSEDAKKYYITKAINVRYDPSARSDSFLKFLLTISRDNKELARFITIVSSLTLIDRIEEKVFFLIGSGYNGKSTLLSVLFNILGVSAWNSKVELLINDDEKNPHLIACKNRTLIIIDEPNMIKLKADIIKKLASTGSIVARDLYKKPEQIEKSFTLLIATNNNPKFDDNTEGTYRRICIIPFLYKINKEESIPNYHDYLLREKEGIFNLLLSALTEYLRALDEQGNKAFDNLMPDIVKYYTNKVIWEQDHIKEFVDRYLIYEVNARTNFSELYKQYEEFCKLKSIDKLSKQVLSKALEKFNFYSTKESKITYKLDCRLRLIPLIKDLEDNDKSDNKVGKVIIKDKVITLVKREDNNLICMHCNAKFNDSYTLAKHIKEIANIDDIIDIRIEDTNTMDQFFSASN